MTTTAISSVKSITRKPSKSWNSSVLKAFRAPQKRLKRGTSVRLRLRSEESKFHRRRSLLPEMRLLIIFLSLSKVKRKITRATSSKLKMTLMLKWKTPSLDQGKDHQREQQLPRITLSSLLLSFRTLQLRRMFRIKV